LTDPSSPTWTLDDSANEYNLEGWGNGFVSIAASGNLEIRPAGADGGAIDLKELVDEVRERGIDLPLLLRFSELIGARLDAINEAFAAAIAESGYAGRYRGVYPIKVNQERYIVEQLLEYGRRWHFGLEAGSKPELLAVIALLDDPEALIICNGYKDEEYVETALLASKLGRRVVIVVEKPSELELLERAAATTGIRPLLGLRARLASRGAGHWQDSGGDRSKFGLSGRELVQAVGWLRQHDLLDRCRLLHFHIGSQIASIHAVKEALREAAWTYVQLRRMGAALDYLDVGGGLGVDYDGTRSTVASSVNYTLQEYANDVVYGIKEVCDRGEVPHPTLVTESGRATVSHHAVLVVDVLDAARRAPTEEPSEPPSDAPLSVHQLFSSYRDAAEPANPIEIYHDATIQFEECLTLFRLGYLSLDQRALVENLFLGTCDRLRQALRGLDTPPEELAQLAHDLADTYFCNFSLFQSLPDSWAIDQVFPIVPLQNLDMEPTRRAVLVDITCDSDGKIDRFVGPHGAEAALRLQPFEGRPYYLGVFLVGAYQEILGDLHNLFGDTNTVAVSLDAEDGYEIDEVLNGETVADVLDYVHYNRRALVAQLRRAVERAQRDGRMTREEGAEMLRIYTSGLDGYTYLEG
jgi:arginine decarboxylase